MRAHRTSEESTLITILIISCFTLLLAIWEFFAYLPSVRWVCSSTSSSSWLQREREIFISFKSSFFASSTLCIYRGPLSSLCCWWWWSEGAARTWKAKVMSSSLHSSANSNCFNVRAKKTFSPRSHFSLLLWVCNLIEKLSGFDELKCFLSFFYSFPSHLPGTAASLPELPDGRSVREATQSSTVRTAQKKGSKSFFYDRIRISESYWLLLILELERNYVCGEVEMERE